MPTKAEQEPERREGVATVRQHDGSASAQQSKVPTSGGAPSPGAAADPALAHQKLTDLQNYLRELGSVAVAFSGGVDSTFLLKVAHDTLGEHAIAITARSESFPEREYNEAADFCRAQGIRHIAVTSDELDIPGFSHNPTNRCYLCKKEFFSQILGQADAEGFRYLCEGSNMDDEGDFRPGLVAVAELGVKSPLRHARLYKSEIRLLSHEMGLPTWNKQSFACLSSRFPYGEEITRKKLAMVDKAEQFLLDRGFRQLRVRIHDGLDHTEIARIEVAPGEMQHLFDDRAAVAETLRAIGFAYVTMDLMGYRTGSMNETLSREERYFSPTEKNNIMGGANHGAR